MTNQKRTKNMQNKQDFEAYREAYFSEKGEYPCKFNVRIFDKSYATIGAPFRDLLRAVTYIEGELKEDVQVYKVELYRFDGVCIESWDWEQ